MTTTYDLMTVRDLIQDAIVILEVRIGSDEEEATDQDVLSLLNDADLVLRRA